MSRQLDQECTCGALKAVPSSICLQERYEALVKEMQSRDKYGLERIALPKRKVD